MSPAPCVGMTDLFFSEHPDYVARAQAICATCPRAEACRAGAQARKEEDGVWGGKLFSRNAARQRKLQVVTCPHCGDPMARNGVPRHVRRRHPELALAA